MKLYFYLDVKGVHKPAENVETDNILDAVLGIAAFVLQDNNHADLSGKRMLRE